MQICYANFSLSDCLHKLQINTVGADIIRPGMNDTNPLPYKTQACTMLMVPGRMISAPTIISDNLCNKPFEKSEFQIGLFMRCTLCQGQFLKVKS